MYYTIISCVFMLDMLMWAIIVYVLFDVGSVCDDLWKVGNPCLLIIQLIVMSKKLLELSDRISLINYMFRYI